ncbi:sugar ABC transporter substrate-binding protein [Pararobbsia silviterrae]|uniref:Sugar ABC transporter substrate-binding protein n=1 Tax=Pararobbsia silviterrae TaxID=1792498 RepID=A0A494Y1G7_9BURK|nr:sugar ABC transporter substrate-binding protein [Pararobbsia silviterrae]
MKPRSALARFAATAVVTALTVLHATTSAADVVTINFLHAQNDRTYGPVIEAFEKANPNIKVREQRVPFDQLNPQVQARIGAGDDSIDLYGVDEPRVPALAKRGLLVDLSAQKDLVLSKTTPEAVAATSANGKLYALPQWTSTQLLFYNKDLLAKAGVEPPSADPAKRLTWDDLLAAAKKVQGAGAKYGVAFEQVDRYYQLQALFESSGAGPGLTGDGLLTPAVNTDKWVKTMAWYGDLYKNGLAPRGITPEQMGSLFINGQIAYFVGGPWNFYDFTKASALKWGIAPHPYFAGGKPVTPTDSWAVGISPHSKHQAEALKFALFMTIDDQGALLSTQTNPLPPANQTAFNRYVAEQTKLGGESTAPYAALLPYELKNTAVSRPRTVGYVAFEEVMNKAFSDVRNGADAKQTLDRANGQLTSIFARLK